MPAASDLTPTAAPQRLAFLEALRLFACYAVIINHTLTIPTGGVARAIAYAVFFFVKTAVPVFFMITGWLLLQKQDTIAKSLRRAGSFALVFLVFSFVYYVDSTIVVPDMEFDLKSFFIAIWKQPITNAFWYLYAYLGILLMLPFLQKMAAGMAKADYLLFFALGLPVSGIWPIILRYYPDMDVTGEFYIPLFSSYLCMLLLGSYCIRFAPEPDRRTLCLAGVLLGAAIALQVGLTLYDLYRAIPGLSPGFWDNRSLLANVLASVCVFTLGRALPLRGRIGRIAASLGRYTFGAYLLSDLYIAKLGGIHTRLLAFCPHVPACLLFSAGVLAAGLLTTWLLCRIPLLRRLLHG